MMLIDQNKLVWPYIIALSLLSGGFFASKGQLFSKNIFENEFIVYNISIIYFNPFNLFITVFLF